MTENKTKKYVDALPDIVDGINAKPLSSLNGLAPKDINFENQNSVFEHKYGDILKYPFKPGEIYPVGTLVRLELKRYGAFDKAYLPNFSEEIYRVAKAVRAPPGVIRYHLTTLRNQPIVGR